MDADKNRVRISIREIDSVFERSRGIVRSRHCDCETRVLQLIARGKCNVESESFFRSPFVPGALVIAAVPRIEHHRLDFVRVADSIRSQDWFDNFAHVHGGNQSVISVTENRKVTKETYAVDIDFARAGLRAQSTPCLLYTSDAADE